MRRRLAFAIPRQKRSHGRPRPHKTASRTSRTQNGGSWGGERSTPHLQDPNSDGGAIVSWMACVVLSLRRQARDHQRGKSRVHITAQKRKHFWGCSCFSRTEAWVLTAALSLGTREVAHTSWGFVTCRVASGGAPFGSALSVLSLSLIPSAERPPYTTTPTQKREWRRQG